MPDKKQELMSHLMELRRRLMLAVAVFLLCSGVSYFFADKVYEFLVAPLAEVLAEQGGDRRLIYTGLGEAFITYMKLAFFTGGFIAFPFMAMQLWRFVAPGLYANEKRALLPFLVATPVLFITGAAFVYYLILPLAWKFFVGFENLSPNNGLPIQLEARVSEYLGLVMSMIFAFGFCFQLPVLLAVMARAGMIDAGMLRRKRRYMILFIFVLAAVVTPPDVISQCLLAIPMLFLYEASILWIARGSAQKLDVSSETP